MGRRVLQAVRDRVRGIWNAAARPQVERPLVLRRHPPQRVGIENALETGTDVLVVGGGLGGVAGALAALRLGRRVVLTEETDWIGGQLTVQAVPPDEHPWIEEMGCTASYRRLRNGIRDFYRRYYPLTAEAHARKHLNLGDGMVSRLCHEPRVALAVLEGRLAPYRERKNVRSLLRGGHVPERERDVK